MTKIFLRNAKRMVRILRRQLKRVSLPFGRASPVGKVLILLLESGGLYCMIWVGASTACATFCLTRKLHVIGLVFGHVLRRSGGNIPLHLSVGTVNYFLLYPGNLHGVLLCESVLVSYFNSRPTISHFQGMYLSMVIVLVCLERTFGEHIVMYSSPSDVPTPRGLTFATTDRPASTHIRSRIEFQQPHSIVQISGSFSSPDIESNPWPARTSMASSRNGASMDGGRLQSQLGPVAERTSYRDSSSEGHSAEVAEKKEDNGFAV